VTAFTAANSITLAAATLGWVPMAAAYGIGSVAAIWTIERIASFWTRKAAVYGNRKPFICIRKSGYRRPMPNGSASVSHEHLRPVLPAVQRCSWQTCRAIAWNRVTLTPTAQRLMQESCPAEKRSYFKGISSASHSGSPI
jgi:hypothetical protein